MPVCFVDSFLAVLCHSFVPLSSGGQVTQENAIASIVGALSIIARAEGDQERCGGYA